MILLLVACAREGDPIPPLPPEAAEACTRQWLTTLDGVPGAHGLEVRDAEGRVVEEAQIALGDDGWDVHTWSEWERDASGTDRLVRVTGDGDGDGVPDGEITYAYALDDRLRLVWEATYTEGEPTREVWSTWDDLDQLVAVDTTSDGEPAGGSRLTWEEGRLVRTDSLGPEGNVWATVTRDYLDPAPALDRYESWTYPWPYVRRLDVDDEDRVLASWLVDDDGAEVLTEANTWDDAGRRLTWVMIWTAGSLWGELPGEDRTTWTYGEDGLVRTVTSERDELADGVVEELVVTEWSWWCE